MKVDLNELTKARWRELGFYYDRDDRMDVNQWRFYGSKKGLFGLVNLLHKYADDESNDAISVDFHYGPYSSLKLMTWDIAQIRRDCFMGTLKDIEALSNAIKRKLEVSHPGDTFTFHEDFGVNNELTAKVFIMSDDFDPVSMDELIVSHRQEVVNKHFGLKY